ncbi:hypothetical protein HWV62_7451 [Athelia sp. TMB]|nr:hypothetical protein HWV62_7451 [Athelia sp. TMB]
MQTPPSRPPPHDDSSPHPPSQPSDAIDGVEDSSPYDVTKGGRKYGSFFQCKNYIQAITRHPTAMSDIALFNVTNTSGHAQVTNVNGNIYNITPDEVRSLASAGKVYTWLAASDSSGNYNTAREKQHAGTGAWLLESEQFTDWKGTPGSALWLYGTPGSGKTIICSTAIESIRQEFASTSGFACAYFFFDSRNAETDLSLCHKMLRSLIRQLAHQSGGVPAALMQMYGGGHEQPPLKSLQLTLHKIIETFKHTYIVIDALDECVDRKKLLAWIGELLQQRLSSLHILVSSRQEQDIVECFESQASLFRVSLAGASTNSDIESYIDAMLSEMARWNAETRARVKSALMEGVDGMFRWVALQIAELSKCLSPRAVEAQLRALPKDLDGMYERSLSQSANPRDLKQLLVWLAFSARPLSVEELADVIPVEFFPDGPSLYNPDLRYFDSTDVLDLCSGFVTFVPIVDGIVKLAHMSVKDYLLSDRIKEGTASHFSIDERLGHWTIASTCLAYLLHSGTIKRSLQELPLLGSYAAKYWVSHVRLCRSDGSCVWKEMTRMFSLEGTALENLVQNLDPEAYSGNYIGPALDIARPLYWAALFGLEELIVELVKVCDRWFEDALHAASHRGHIGTVRILLEHGENVNAQGQVYGRALGAAIQSGYTDLVRLLLEKGADVNAPAMGFGSPLKTASVYGKEAIVRLLLERGADVNALGPIDDTALQATSSGNEAIVRLLLEKGADIRSQSRKATGLSVRNEMVQLLLKKREAEQYWEGRIGAEESEEDSDEEDWNADTDYAGSEEDLEDADELEYSHDQSLRGDRGGDGGRDTMDCREPDGESSTGDSQSQQHSNEGDRETYGDELSSKKRPRSDSAMGQGDDVRLAKQARGSYWSTVL